MGAVSSAQAQDKKFPRTAQATPFLQNLFEAFETNNVVNALELVKMVSEGIYTLDPSATFCGSCHCKIRCESHSLSEFLRDIIKLPQSVISEGLALDTNFREDRYHTKEWILVDGVKPYVLAFVFSHHDKRRDRGTPTWLDVFKKLVELSTCDARDTIFGVSIIELITRGATNCHQWHHHPRGFPYDRDSYRKILRGFSVRHLVGLKDDPIETLIGADHFEVVNDLLSVGDREGLLSAKNYLFFVEERSKEMRDKDRVKYLRLLTEKGQRITDRRGDDYPFTVAIKAQHHDSVEFYLSTFDLVPLFPEGRILHCLLDNLISDEILKLAIAQAKRLGIPVVNAKDERGVTPLHSVCRSVTPNMYSRSHEQIDAMIRTLIINGADIHEKDSAGTSMVDLVCFGQKLPQLARNMVTYQRETASLSPPCAPSSVLGSVLGSAPEPDAVVFHHEAGRT